MASQGTATFHFLSCSVSFVSTVLWAVSMTDPSHSPLQGPSLTHTEDSTFTYVLVYDACYWFQKQTPLKWAELLWIDVCIRKLQSGRTFPLQLVGVLFCTLRVMCSALHMNVPEPSVPAWELPSYLRLWTGVRKSALTALIAPVPHRRWIGPKLLSASHFFFSWSGGMKSHPLLCFKDAGFSWKSGYNHCVSQLSDLFVRATEPCLCVPRWGLIC